MTQRLSNTMTQQNIRDILERSLLHGLQALTFSDATSPIDRIDLFIKMALLLKHFKCKFAIRLDLKCPKPLDIGNMSRCMYVCCTLRSWLHEISALIMTLSPGLEKNYTLERSSKSFPGMTSMSGCLENCQKHIPKSQCSPIQETRS